jgi:hypothetical protein
LSLLRNRRRSFNIAAQWHRNQSRKKRVPRRKEERFQTELVLRLDGGQEGVARNVSPSGIFFVTQAVLEEGQPVSFSLEFQDFPSGPVEVNGSARVVRVVEQGASRGIGASIDSFEFRTLPKAGGSNQQP